MTDLLERQLVALSLRLDVDVDDRLVDDVLRRLESEPQSITRSITRSITPRRLTIAGLALAASIAAVIAIPSSRQAVANWFGIGSTRIERTPIPSTASPATTTVVVFPAQLDLGQPVSTVEARELTGLPVPVAAALGTPSGVFVVVPPESGQIVVVYPALADLPASPVAGVGALLSTVAGRLDRGLLLKVAQPGTIVENLFVTVASGARVSAIWLAGEPHSYAVVDDEDHVVFDTLRLATNTLLWMDGGVVFRLEAELTLEQAIEIAATVVDAA